MNAPSRCLCKLSALIAAAILAIGFCPSQQSFAQQLPVLTAGPRSDSKQQASDNPTFAAADLPDAPVPTDKGLAGVNSSSASTSSSGADAPRRSSALPARIAPVYHRYIEPNETAQRLTPQQQLIFGLAQSVSPYFLLTVGAAAGYEQAVNGSPNYGSNITAFGQRVGAAAARNASQSFFSDSLMAPLLREDPRFYIMGKRRNAFVRATYAATRIIVTRDADDEAHLVPNYAEVSGYAEAAILTNAYYPAVNVHVRRTVESFGLSLEGAAISNVVREFFPDLLHLAHRE